MVCYARPVTFLTAILIVAWLAFSGPVSHSFATAAVLVAVLVATGARRRPWPSCSPPRCPPAVAGRPAAAA